MKVCLLASAVMCLGVVFEIFAALPAEPDEDLGAGEIVSRMIESDERNYQAAREFEYLQKTVTEELDDRLEVVNSRSKTTRQKLERYLSYRVQGLDTGENVETDVGFSAPEDDGEERDGTYLEAMTIRELSRFYEFRRERDEEIAGRPYYVLSFRPKVKEQLPKARSQEQKVLAHLTGKLWVHPVDFMIVKSDSHLVSPLPFAWIDLVSLRDLRIRYDAEKLEDRVWLPRSMEVFYQVRVVYFTNIRERQKTTMSDFQRVEASDPVLPK